MESNRTWHRVGRRAHHRQSGITVIGFLILASLVGTVGMAGLKIFPLYMERMRIGTVLDDLQDELGTGGNTAQGIRQALESRLYIESLELSRDEVDVTRSDSGFVVKIDREAKAPFFADLWFVVVIDKQVEISR